MRFIFGAGACVLAGIAASACSWPAPAGPLIPASTTMVTAWQVPLDPTKDATLTDPKLADQIRWGYRIFVDTPHEAPRFTGGTVSCNYIANRVNAGLMLKDLQR